MNVQDGMLRLLAFSFLATIFAVDTIAQDPPRNPPGGNTIERPQSKNENGASGGWAEVVAHARPAVVVIETDKGLGSGFVIKPDGTIVTNAHVVADANAMAVKFASGEVYRNVYLLSSDSVEDLAFIKIEAVDLPTISLGNSNEVQVGEDVLLVGAPQGLEQTVSNGLVSGVRVDEGVRVIQTSAAASPGSSGGPLLNRRGEAVGVMSFKVVNGENLNFTIPINYVRGKLDGLTLSKPKGFVPLEPLAEMHRGVWVAGRGFEEFRSVFMETLDFLGSNDVEIANDTRQRFANLNETGYVPLTALIEKLHKTGADSLLYVKVESAPSLGRETATVYFQCFDVTGRLLWEEKATDVLANGETPFFTRKAGKAS